MTFLQLKYIVTIAETGTISEAARQLFISQPSLTSAVKELEHELGITIFNRTNKGVLLSVEGEEFLGYARQVIEQTNLIEERYLGREPVKHQFCVSTQHYSFAVQAFVDLLTQYGGDKYEFRIRETQTYELIEDVAKLRSEVGVLYMNRFNETILRKTLKRNNLTFHRLFIAKPHPFVEYFKFLKQFEDDNTVAKYTIPAPAQMFQQLILPMNIRSTREFYPDNEELIYDIGTAYQEVIQQFYDAGCRNLQLDDCTWGAIVGDVTGARYKATGMNLEEIKAQLLKVNNLALEAKPSDIVINSHICRGNYHSTFFGKGAYDSVADYVFARENVDALYLEYDDERSGGFAPLAKVSPDKKVVLGLITTKSPKLEDKETVIKRIHEAAKYIPLDRLCLSPQCGFASCEIGNKLTEEEQWAKLALVKEIAEEVWGK